MPTVITLKQLHNYILDDVSLTIPGGDIFAIIGASGAGQSTLLRCINGLEKPARGEVWVADKQVNALSGRALQQLRQRIGMIFQHFNLCQQRNVFANVALPLQLIGMPSAEAEARVTELLELVGLSAHRLAYPATLSGGQRQRVAIARALATKPDILLCDEPTSALDPQATQSVLECLQTINAELNVTIVFITHEMQVVKTIARQVAVLEQGRLIEQNATEKLFAAPQHVLTQRLVHDGLQNALAPALQAQLETKAQNGYSPLLRLNFVGAASKQPLLAELMYSQGLKLSFLQANIDHIQNQSFGTMVMQLLSTQADDLQHVETYCREHQVTFEVLGYVPLPN